MATEEIVKCITVEAGADLSAGQYCFVLVAADGQVDLVGSAGGKGTGVLQNDPAAAGRAATVAVEGVTKVIAGGTVASGASVQSDANGHAIEAASGDYVLGECLVGGVDNDVITILLVSQHVLA